MADRSSAKLKQISTEAVVDHGAMLDEVLRKGLVFISIALIAWHGYIQAPEKGSSTGYARLAGVVGLSGYALKRLWVI